MSGYNIEEMKQSCKECVFQIRDNQNMQIGCEFGRPEKLRNTVDVFRDEDEGSFFFDRKCNRHTTTLYNSVEQTKSIVIEETKVNYGVMVYVNESTSIKELEDTILSINQQKIHPTNIVFLLNNHNYSFSKEITSIFTKHKVKMLYKINFVIEKNQSKEYLYDINIKRFDSMFVYFIVSGYTIPEDFSERLDKSYNDELEYISLVMYSDNSNDMLVNRKLYLALGGNTGKDPEGELEGDIINKIQYMAKKESKQYHIKYWSR